MNLKTQSQPESCSLLYSLFRHSAAKHSSIINRAIIAEEFYLKGLSLKPDHNGINEYLGELYVQTNRIDKANERLEVLKSCNCKEYSELELIIKTKGSKVY